MTNSIDSDNHAVHENVVGGERYKLHQHPNHWATRSEVKHLHTWACFSQDETKNLDSNNLQNKPAVFLLHLCLEE